MSPIAVLHPPFLGVQCLLCCMAAAAHIGHLLPEGLTTGVSGANMAAMNRNAGCITIRWRRYLALVLTIAVCLGAFFPNIVSASAEGLMDGVVSRLNYIDPGTGSIIVQVLIGAVVGGLAMMGIYRVRVKNFLLNLFKRRKDDEESDK